jgi:hypothetical protein
MRRRIVRSFAFVAALALSMVAGVATCALAEQADFFFYSPQVGTGNLSQLKETADRFLRESGTDLTFQPFARLEDLQREFGRHRPAFLVLPDWVAMEHCLGASLLPISRPTRDGRLFDRRALVATGDADQPADIAGGSIAATVPSGVVGSGSRTLSRFRVEHPDVRVIPVPKDIDALLAVGFGQVDGAFVSMSQFDTLARVNPALTATLHEIGYSIATPFPAVYATEFASEREIAALRAALGASEQSESGRRLARLLGYDGWQPTAADEVSIPAAGCAAAGEVKP